MENNKEIKEDDGVKELGSNLTGTAVPSKAGHGRDIPIEQYVEENLEENKEKQNDDEKSQNTDSP